MSDLLRYAGFFAHVYIIVFITLSMWHGEWSVDEGAL